MGDDVFDELRNTGEHVAVFNEIAKALTSTLEPHEVLRSIMKQISLVVQPTSWSLLLEDEATGELYFELAVGSGSEKLKGMRLARDEGVAGLAFISGEAQIVQDISKAKHHARRFDQITAVETKNLIALPLRVRDKSLGVLELVNGLDKDMSREELQSLKAIADYAAIAIHNARNFRRLQELTIKDDHTGLFNARHLRERLTQEVERALRFNHPLSLIFLDLDHFKAANDMHGHVMGSELLLEVGAVLTSSIRKVDSAYRYGGDEFAVMLVETDASAALRVAKRLQARVERQLFLAQHHLDLRVTASFGVATFPDDVAGASELLQAADQAMYRAKARGRNMVVAAGDNAR